MPIIKSIYWDQTGDDVLVYLFPFKDITTGSILTVNDSQEAYFYKNGSLCDKFEAGRHVLSTSNLPIIQKIVNLPSGGESTFKASVWFVSKLDKRNLLWGAGGLRIIDPYFQIPIKISARGQYGVRIKDGGLFLLKFVGTQSIATMDTINEQFRIDVIEAFKISVAKFMKENELNINELGSEYRSINKIVKNELQETFDEYGVELLNFNIEDISFDENDKGYQTVMEGIAEQAKLKKLGVDYLKQKQIEVAQTLAGNQGAGTFMGAGIGLGVGQQMGSYISHMMDNSPLNQATNQSISPSFYVAENGQTIGPFKLDIIKQKIMLGEITTSTFVYRMGGSAWIPASQEAEIANIFAELLPPPPPPSNINK